MIALMLMLGCGLDMDRRPAADASVEDLGWMTGSWAVTGKALTEEHWTAPVGGTMMGVGRTIKDGREWIRIHTAAASVRGEAVG